MSAFTDTRFIFEPEAEFQISFRAKAADCGKVFAIGAPHLDTGLLFMVKTGVSCAYTFRAAEGLFLTVTAISCTAVKRECRHFRKTPSARHLLKVSAPLVRRVSVLRL